MAAVLCKLFGHRKVRVIEGLQLDRITTAGALGGTVTSERWECRRCRVQMFSYREAA